MVRGASWCRIFINDFASFGDVNNICFLCGCDKAIWILSSKPSLRNEPFFPFLQHESLLKSCNLGGNGKYKSCNICYIFLIQQWNAYEINKTPHSKRLYWLKHPKNVFLQQNEEHKLKKPDENDAEVDESRLDNINFSCTTCSSNIHSVLLNYIYINETNNAKTPFFTDILCKENFFFSSNDKVGVCPACYEILTRQWFFYEKNDVPFNLRKYTVEKVFERNVSYEFSCYLCQEILKPLEQEIIYCKFVKDNPYFPFLKNLSPNLKCFPITDKGFTFSCLKCKIFLNKQWKEFENSNIDQEERVYCIKDKKELVYSNFFQITAPSCCMCLKIISLKEMKRISFGCGSNLNTEFLDLFFKANNIAFNKESGSEITCKECFDKIIKEWKIHYASLFDCNNKEKVCEICKKHCTKSTEVLVIAVNDEPYFPVLQHLCRPDKITVNACLLCSDNLLNQWKCKRNLLQIRVNDFICSLCEKEVNNQCIYLQSIVNLNHGILLQSNPFCVRIGDKIVVCKECNEKSFKDTSSNNIEVKGGDAKTVSDTNQTFDMKATATVLPFLSLGTDVHPPSASLSDGNCSKVTSKFIQQHPSPLLNSLVARGKNLTSEMIGEYYGDYENYEKRSCLEMQLNSTHKDQPRSNIGLVLPQPSKTLRFEENQLPGSFMSSSRYKHDAAVTIRSPSPRFTSFLPLRLPHVSQSSCPVHSQELGTQLDERFIRQSSHTHEDIRGRFLGLPIDQVAHTTREFNSIYAQHSHIREDVYSRHTSQQAELKDHRAMKEDVRRRGLDYRWNAFPPHLVDEHYRKHLMNGLEHTSYKELMQPPLYPPHFYYGRNHPPHIDSYMHYPLPQGDSRHQHASLSPQIGDFFRRKQDTKFDERYNQDILKDHFKRKSEQAEKTIEEKSLGARKEQKEIPNGQNMPLFKGINATSRSPGKCQDSGQQDSVHSLVISDCKTELAAASILANMNLIKHESPSNGLECGIDNHQTEISNSNQEISEEGCPELENKKLAFFIALGLVTHSRKRVLESEININRWNKMSLKTHNGRPKKKVKKEIVEDGSSNGDTRANSEIDFYTGPMTRHKQQMLQEQESLLEEIKRRSLADSVEEQVEECKSIKKNSINSIEKPFDDTKSVSKETASKSRLFPDGFNKMYKLYQPKIVSSPEKENYSSPKGDKDRNAYSEHTHHEENGFRRTEHEVFKREKFHEIDQESYCREPLSKSESEFMKKDDFELRNRLIYSGMQNNRTARENLYARNSFDTLDYTKFYSNTDNEFARYPVIYSNNDNESSRYPNEASPERFLPWPGVEAIGLSYKAYHTDLVMRRNHLIKTYEFLNQEGRNALLEREQLEKDMIIYNDRRMRIVERRQSMRQSLESMTNTLRNMSNL
ncbi:uncharacterized protein LOC100207809 isoform X10 [Hydra vulgaris]|uniref:Uncharacterized protein LOC100207809 isoform X10 n=2 Tax=Hydra vulgaris TaxID=6087 RepID=A0ABM4DQJ0_HYDVU